MLEAGWLVLLILTAVAAGAVVGLLPGLNPVLGLLLILPMLMDFNAHEIVIFWMCYICATQYYGSVAALWLRVPGETSSLPVLNHSRDLRTVPAVLRCYRLTAFGSLVASLSAVILFAVTVYALQDHWLMFFRTQWMAVFFLIVLMLLLVTNRHRWVTAGVILLGLCLSILPRTDAALNSCSLDPVWCWSLKPTDINLALLCLYGLPFVFASNYFAPRLNTAKVNHTASQWYSHWKFRWVSVKHAMIGFVIGLVPGMGVTLSANVSAAIEHGRQRVRRLRVMCAAESANNSAIISSTLPFLLLGIPITGTELVLDSWFIVHKAQSIDAQFLYTTVNLAGWSISYVSVMIVCVLLANLLCFALVSRFSRFYQRISDLPKTLFDIAIKSCIMLLLIFSIQQSGLNHIGIVFTMLIFSMIGIWSHRRGIDVTALPICMILGPMAADKIVAAYYITF